MVPSGEPLPANGSTVNGSSPPDNDKSLLLQMKMKAERNNNLNNGKSSPDSNKHAAEVTGNGEKGGCPSTPILLDTPPPSTKTSAFLKGICDIPQFVLFLRFELRLRGSYILCAICCNSPVVDQASRWLVRYYRLACFSNFLDELLGFNLITCFKNDR